MAPNATTRIGHGLAKVLGIKLQYRDPTGEGITRGESVFSVSSADTYVEEEPTSLEWIKQVAPSGRTFINWSRSLFPFTHWIGRYNAQWLAGDLVAGILSSLIVLESFLGSCKYRYHCGSCCRSSIDGICQTG